MREFNANAVAAVELPDLDTFAVVLAEDADGDGERLEITKALAFDEQDRTLGMDTYSLCTRDGAVCYGGVTSWTLAPGTLTLRLDARAAQAVGEEGFVVHFPPEHLQLLRDGLTRVLD